MEYSIFDDQAKREGASLRASTHLIVNDAQQQTLSDHGLHERIEEPTVAATRQHPGRQGTPEAIQERLYEENHQLKQKINGLEREACKLKVMMSSQDADIVKKIRLIGRCNHSTEIENILEQDVKGLKKRNSQLEHEIQLLKAQLIRLQKSSRVVQLIQLQAENSELRESNTKLQVKYELLCKHQTESGQTIDESRYEHEALSYLAANRIEKLTRKNTELCRQNSSLRNDIALIRSKLRQFEQENQQLLVQRLEIEPPKEAVTTVSSWQAPQPTEPSEVANLRLQESDRKLKRLQLEHRKLCAKHQQLKKEYDELFESKKRSKEEAKFDIYQKDFFQVTTHHLESIKGQLLEVSETSQQAFQTFYKDYEAAVTIEQAVSLLENSPFFISQLTDRLKLARYLIEIPDNRSDRVNPKETVPMRIFFSNFERLVKTLRTEKKQKWEQTLKEILVFARMNVLALQTNCFNLKEQELKPSSGLYRLSELLDNLNDLDIHNKFAGIVEEVRSRNSQHRTVSWEEFLECFKTLAQQKIT